MRFGKGTAAGGLAASAAVVVALAMPDVKLSEGLRTKAYLDPVEIPTICYGETLGVKMGDTATVAECEAKLAVRLAGFLEEMRACTSVKLPAKTEAAFLSFTYNLGSGTYCKNMARKRLNQGLYQEACDALLLYTKAGLPRRQLPGLVKRRVSERELCVEGLREAGLTGK